MRTRARKDGNQTEIVDGLRAVGVKVHVLNQADIPDLLIGYRGRHFLLFEVKNNGRPPSARKLRPGQQKFADEWKGYPIYKVESLDEALAILRGR